MEIDPVKSLVTLKQLFPQAFRGDKLFVRGIRGDMLEAIRKRFGDDADAVSEDTINAGLRQHCRSIAYLQRASTAGAVRYNLRPVN